MGEVPLGVRLNNPGNIRRSKIQYKGLKVPQSNEEFFEFETAIYGIRAMSMDLQAYEHKDGCRTIAEIVTRWAPPTENKTQAYISFVENQTGIPADKDITVEDFDTCFALIKAIIHQEQGYIPYTDAQITKALVLSGIQPKADHENKSRTVRGQQIVASAIAANATLSAARENIDSASDALQQLVPYTHYAQYGLFGLAICGVALTLWAYFDDNRKGLHP